MSGTISTEPSGDTATESARLLAAGRASARRRALWFLAALLCISLVAGGIWAWQWHAHPTALDGPGSSFRSVPRPVDQPFYSAVTSPGIGDGPVLTLHDARPRIVGDTAASEIEYLRCTVPATIRPTADGTITSIGTGGEAMMREMCLDPVPLHDGLRLDLSADAGQQLVMRVTPTQPGKVRIRGTDLTYSDGWQRGTQVVGEHLTLPAR